MEWQPIETAPKDGTEILVCALNGGKGPGMFVAIVCYFAGEWTTDKYSEDGAIWPPIYWMKPPAPPEHHPQVSA